MSENKTTTVICSSCCGTGENDDIYEPRFEMSTEQVDSGQWSTLGCSNCGGSGAKRYNNYYRKKIESNDLKKGSGKIKVTYNIIGEVCPHCEGEKEVHCIQVTPTHKEYYEKCRHCFGTGKKCEVVKTEPETGCFVTTVVCEVLGRDDNCEQLQVLRHLRDHYVLKLPEGQELFQQYRIVSERVIQKIREAENQRKFALQIYLELLKIVKLTKENLFVEALEKYISLVVALGK